MAFRTMAKLTKIGTKAGLAGGTLYIFYEAGLWKSSDETIENYDKFKKDCETLYEATPTDFRKWVDYGKSTVNSNVEPIQKSVTDFRKEWLNFDLSWLTEPGDGIITPAWNRGVCWTIETIKESPSTMKKWGSTGWQKITELANESPSSSGASGSDVKQ